MPKKFSVILFLLVFIISPGVSFGQGILVPESPQALTLKISPVFPKPNSTITVSAESLNYDLDRAVLAWTVNGAEYQSGAGLKRISLETLGNGETMVVAVSVATLDGFRLSRSVTIRPSSVDLLWEAVSYTPPFYQGKGLISHEGVVKVVAMPELVSSTGSRLSPAGLIYKWSKDGTVLGGQSGLGKDTLVFRMPQLTESSTISVEVSSADSLISGRASITLRSRNPQVYLYENHPLFGVRFERALLGESALSGNEIVITGYPYYFSAENAISSNLKHTWRINRSITSLTKNNITLRVPEGGRGRSQVTYKVDNIKEIMQSAQTTIDVLFGAEDRDNNPFF